MNRKDKRIIRNYVKNYLASYQDSMAITNIGLMLVNCYIGNQDDFFTLLGSNVRKLIETEFSIEFDDIYNKQVEYHLEVIDAIIDDIEASKDYSIVQTGIFPCIVKMKKKYNLQDIVNAFKTLPQGKWKI